MRASFKCFGQTALGISQVLGEYRFGVVNSTRREALETWLEVVESACVVLAPDADTARHYAVLRDSAAGEHSNPLS